MERTFRQFSDLSCPVIDADAHVNEPGDLWETRVPAKWRDRAPKLMHTDHGDVWSFDNGKRTWNLGLTATAGLDFTKYVAEGQRYEDIRPASFDPVARLDEMDLDGLWAQVLYPSVTLTGSKTYSEEPELQVACVRAYNEWIAEFCERGKGRLVGQAIIPSTGIEDAVSELEYAIELGLKGAIIARFPNGTFAYERNADERFFGRAQEAKIPVAVHTGSFLPGNPSQSWPDMKSIGTIAMGSAARAGVQSIPVATNLIFSGLFDDFPDLRVVLVESNIGWIPTLTEQMDDSYLRLRFVTGAAEYFKRMPSEIFKRNIFATFVVDMAGIAQRERLNMRHVCWSTDYPHSITDWPNSRRTIEQVFAGLPVSEVEAVVSGNAADLYGIEVQK
ncbi:MAG TPA: amidohydrolase family protein [Candidatus Dormibacteraeota bacterium]|jgi:predicted TIM-barrel fold metal-dependent hydrolase|nr:amidohydrolase family protein [Candidatus Dormibacteraeota bacterium]